jgi:hypothetical protein
MTVQYNVTVTEEVLSVGVSAPGPQGESGTAANDALRLLLLTAAQESTTGDEFRTAVLAALA